MNELKNLEELYKMKEKGKLSEKEYEAQKQLLLQAVEVGQRPVKSQLVYVVLAFLFGILGIHNFYLGRWKRGLAQLLLTILPVLLGFIFTIPWVVINIFAIHTDGKGRSLKPCRPAKYICGVATILFYIYILRTLYIAITVLMLMVKAYTVTGSVYNADNLNNYALQIALQSIVDHEKLATISSIDCNRVVAMPEKINVKCVLYPEEKIVFSEVDAMTKSKMLKFERVTLNQNGDLVYSLK